MNQPIRILIVDDRARSRAGLRALLSTWPQAQVVAEVADGWQAIAFIEKHQPHVVLMDIRMPRMSGLEATSIIKARWPQVKIIILTMYAAYRDEALAIGADAFLVKGCPAEELLNEIASGWEGNMLLAAV